MAVSSNIKARHVAGAVAGNVAVAGIKKGDRIIAVNAIGLTEGAPNTFSGLADLTAEFTVTADGIINNAAGTSSAAKLLFVMWEITQGGREDFTRQGSGRVSY